MKDLDIIEIIFVSGMILICVLMVCVPLVAILAKGGC